MASIRGLAVAVVVTGVTILLTASCSSEVDATRNPSATASQDSASVNNDSGTYSTATDLMDRGLAAGLSPCEDAGPFEVFNDTATDVIACFDNVAVEQSFSFRIYPTEAKRDRDIEFFKTDAEKLAYPGEPTDSLLYGDTWLIAGNLAKLEQVRDEVGGTIWNLETRMDKAAKAPVRQTPTPRPEPTPKPAPKPPPGPPGDFAGDGTFEVGVDVAAGTYTSAGPKGEGYYCVVYASSKPGDLGSWIRGSTLQGQSVIELNAGEWVTSQFCKPFALR